MALDLVQTLRLEELGFSTSVIVNMNISKSNGRGPLNYDPSDDGIVVKTQGGKSQVDTYLRKLGIVQETDPDKVPQNKWLLAAVDAVPNEGSIRQLFASKDAATKSLNEYRRQLIQQRNTELEPLFAAKGTSIEQVREDNAEINRRLQEARKQLGGIKDASIKADIIQQMEGLKDKLTYLTSHVIVVTVQIQEIWNRSVGSQVEIPIDAIVDTQNSDIFRRYSYREEFVIPFMEKMTLNIVTGILTKNINGLIGDEPSKMAALRTGDQVAIKNHETVAKRAIDERPEEEVISLE